MSNLGIIKQCTHPEVYHQRFCVNRLLVFIGAGVTANIHSPKKALPTTYLLANKYSPVFFSQDKKTPGSVYLPVNKYCLGKYLLPFSYSVSIIGHNSHRFTPKPSLHQVKSNFLRNELVNKSRTSKFRKSFNPIKFFLNQVIR